MKYPAAALICLLLATGAVAAQLEHPALFFNATDVPRMRERAESTGWMRARRERLIHEAETLLSTPTKPADYVEQNLAGRNRPRFTGRLAKARIETLAQAGYLSGDERFLSKARDILLAVVRDYDPTDRNVWSNHLHYSAAAQTVVIAYDLLYPYLTAPERVEVRDEIRKYGQLLFTDDSTWGADAPGVTSSNHNAIRYGALGLALWCCGPEAQRRRAPSGPRRGTSGRAEAYPRPRLLRPAPRAAVTRGVRACFRASPVRLVATPHD